MRRVFTSGLILSFAIAILAVASAQQNNTRMHAEAEVIELMPVRMDPLPCLNG